MGKDKTQQIQRTELDSWKQESGKKRTEVLWSTVDLCAEEVGRLMNNIANNGRDPAEYLVRYWQEAFLAGYYARVKEEQQ